MIKINLQNTIEEFQIGDHTYSADFSDEALRRYFKNGKEVDEIDKQIEAEYPDIENEQDFSKVAGAIIAVLPKRAESYKRFFDQTFGEGKGEEIYSLCGESTPNMQKVFEAVWRVILDKMQNIESEGQRAAKKYVKNNNIEK